MPLIDWDDRFSVHDDTIDRDHRHLVQLLNDAYDDFVKGAPAESLGAVIQDLLDYATHHFATEERLMAERGYHDLEEHREEHGRFVLKVARLQKDFQGGDRRLAVETISFLKSWITHHILENDLRYGAYLAEPGKKPH